MSEAEEVVGTVEQGGAGPAGGGFGVEAVEPGGLGLGGVEFLEGEGFAGETGEGVDEAGEFLGLGVAGGGGDGETGELVEHLGGSEVQAGLGEGGGVGSAQESGGELGLGGDVFEPFPAVEPVLIAALFPFMEVASVEVLAVVAKALDDIGAGVAIQEEGVDLVADGFGQAGNFAVALVEELGRSRGAGGLWWGRDCGRGGGDGLGVEFEDLRFGVHRDEK